MQANASAVKVPAAALPSPVPTMAPPSPPDPVQNSPAQNGTVQDGTATRLVRRIDRRISGLTTLLVSADAIAIAVAVVLTGAARGSAAWVALALLVCCRASSRIYRSRLRLSWFDDVPRELVALAVAAGAFGLTVTLLDRHPDLLVVSATLVLAVLNASVLRAAVFQAARVARRRFGRGVRTVVVGTGRSAVELTEAMLDHPEFGLRPVAMVRTGNPGAAACPVLELDGPLLPTLRHLRASSVVFACPETPESEILDSAIVARRAGAVVLLVPRMSELYHDGSGVERLRSYPLVRLASDPTRRPSWWVKRAFDACLALLGLVVVAPVLGAAALAVLLESGRPIFFAQQRIGLDGQPFTLYKLRSLRPVNETEQQTLWSVAHDPRIGPVGRFLRRTSLDELPQLWNIVRGDMSLVGPRPERPSFVAKFSADHDRYAARHRVPTGLTGLAQVNGLRGDTSIADRVRHDNYYIANWSLWLDVRILVLTVREMLRTGHH